MAEGDTFRVLVMRKNKAPRSKLPFVAIYDWMRRTPAWRDLTPQARAVYVELKGRFNGTNNGRLGYGAREAGADIGMSSSSANRFLLELEEHGFIQREQESSFGQKRLAVEWRLTELKNDRTGDLATKDFLKWKAGDGNQKPVPPVKTTVPPMGQHAAKKVASSADSHIHGTVAIKHGRLQSHPRDTSTSKPSGATTSLMNETSSTKGRPVLFDKVLKAVSSIESVSPESSRSVALSLYEDLIAELHKDPLSRLVLDTFPGSQMTMTQSDVAVDVKRRLERLRSD